MADRPMAGGFQLQNRHQPGTRLKAAFYSPEGVRLYVGTDASGFPGSALLTANEPGPFAPVSATKTLDGIPVAPVARLPWTGVHCAVWEVIRPSRELYEFPIFVEYGYNPQDNLPRLGTASVLGSSPNATHGAFSASCQSSASPELPIPRYVDTSRSTFLFQIVP